MIKKLALATAILFSTCTASFAQTGFILGLAVGSSMQGGGGGSGTLLFRADDETLKKVDLMDVRHVDTYFCANRYSADKMPTLGYIIEDKFGKGWINKITLLEIHRFISPTSSCPTFWFMYVLKN